MQMQAECITQDENSADTHDQRIHQLISELKNYAPGCIKGEMVIPAREGEYAPLPESIDTRLAHALRKTGIEQLYTHQKLAWDNTQSGNHSVIVTPTASGKTLCYNLPVIHAALRNGEKSLYLFPTKALSQDQVAAISKLNQAADLGIKAFTFDGDTPGDARKAVRTRGDIVVSNPDMLHQGILPHHTKWAQFFEQLKYIVIDEMHTYRGVFGSHMSNVIRRLKRICKFYGSEPQFILCSATIANPAELAHELIGESVTCIEENGAPQGEKNLLLWNPPVVNSELGIRASSRSQTTTIARKAIDLNLQSIVFAQSRLAVEVLTKYLKDRFDSDPRYPSRISAYRGGYLPSERREVERALREDKIDCVVCTSALELGVDIGALDICILDGYPGTIAATWQRLGRAGRRKKASVGVLIANSSPVNQYMMQHPDYFMDASPEHARISPEQLLILLDHIRCAAFELPFREGDIFSSSPLKPFLEYLEQEQVLHHEGNQWHWMNDSYPANSVSLRSVAEGNFVVIDTTGGAQNIIAEVDYHAAPMTLYEGAIYMIQANPWQVEKLDWIGRKAFVSKTKADYYTDAIDYTRLKILESFNRSTLPETSCNEGEVHLLKRFSGYKKIRYYTHENIGYGEINLPDQEMHTTSIWWQVNHSALDRIFETRWQALDGFMGAAHALHFIAAFLSMSEVADIGKAVGNADATWFATVGKHARGKVKDFNGNNADINTHSFQPAVFLYDNYPGGIGITNLLYRKRNEIIKKSIETITACACETGCPTCVGAVSPASKEDGNMTHKQSALMVLKLLSTFPTGSARDE